MIRFDDISREERYFSATILPYLFAYKNFSGLRTFENKLFEERIIQSPSLVYKNVQLISEVSLERDLPFAKIAIPSSAFKRKLKRQTKPDLMVITNESLYLMECKVFMNESEFKLHRQILEQKYILDIVEQVTEYAFENQDQKRLFLNSTVLYPSHSTTN